MLFLDVSLVDIGIPILAKSPSIDLFHNFTEW